MVLAIATAGLVYELAIAAVASYLLGDSVRQFSLIIGTYLSALGLGAHLSRYVGRRLASAFVDVELAAALVGGWSAPALFLAFAYTRAFEVVLFSVVVAVGVLVGLELPLLLRILERRVEFKELVARALAFDYAGALVGSLAFSALLVPRLGLTRSSLACGLLNAMVGLIAAQRLPASDAEETRALRRARVRAVLVVLALTASLVEAGHLTEIAEAAVYPGRVVLAEQSAHQRLVVTDHDGAFELFLNGNLQFSSKDEYRYHEALVHPAMSAARARRRVVVGGGGDGLAVREILKWPEVESVTVVDLDRAVTDLARSYEPLVALNRGSLGDPRVHVVTEDAMSWFGDTHDTADVVVLDFPDPGSYSVGKLYSTALYERVARRLEPSGVIVVQSSSPFLSPDTFSCVARTLAAAGFDVRPYRVFVPSFGVWGFVLGSRRPLVPPTSLPPAPLRFLDEAALRDLFRDPPILSTRVAVNRLDNQAIVSYYVTEWARWEGR
jgi:spermidine synthase